MPLEPPDPLHILSALREQSKPLRLLVEAFPTERGYRVALDGVEAAIVALEAATKALTR